MASYLSYAPGLRDMIARSRGRLGTDHPSTVSYALRRASSLRIAQAMMEILHVHWKPRPNDLIALDSMAITLRRSLRHGCVKINRHTVGGGVLWAMNVDAPAQTNPIRILKIIAGAWSDSRVVREIELDQRGPVYLMDRGFWALDLVQSWLEKKVRFILRATGQDFQFQTIGTRGPPRTLPGGVRIDHDVVARLGGPARKIHPRVRLVFAWTARGENLILVSDRMRWSAERILASYKRRWEIERFHQFIKQTVGMAHLYSFQRDGIFFLLHVATVLAILLFMTARPLGRSTIEVLRAAMERLHEDLGVMHRWRPNTQCHRFRSEKRRKRNMRSAPT